MTIGSIITDFGGGLVSLLPLLGEALVQTFLALFFVTSGTEGNLTYALNPLGNIAIFFLIVSACYKFIPMVVGWFRLRSKGSRRRRRARA